ncbi:MAG TPA: hypothetical protein VK119_02420 [Bacillota bacterium]|nr:hypothetical protein [Bacillota bacterium]
MIEVYDVALIPLIVGLVELLKGFGLPKKWLPIVSILFGITAGVLYVHPDDLKGAIIVGLMLGMAASGLYSGTKNTIEKSDN